MTVQFYYYTSFETHTHKTMYCVYFKFTLSLFLHLALLLALYFVHDAIHLVTTEHKNYEIERLNVHYRANIAWYSACNATGADEYQRPFRAAPKMIVIDCQRIQPPAHLDVRNQSLHDMARHLHDEWDYTGAESYTWCLLLVEFIVYGQAYWFSVAEVIVLCCVLWLFGRYGPWRYAWMIKYQLELVSYHPPDKDKSVYDQEQFSLNKKVE